MLAPRAPPGSTLDVVSGMTRASIWVPFLVVMIAVVVGLDLLFFRHHFLARLLANIGVVLVFLAFYLRFLRPS